MFFLLGNYSEAISLKLVDSPGSQFEIQVKQIHNTLLVYILYQTITWAVICTWISNHNSPNNRQKALYHITQTRKERNNRNVIHNLSTGCKRTAYSSLDNLVWVSIIQLALGFSESTINSSLPSCSCCHGMYYIALLDSVVISVLICVPVATSAQTKLVQYKQLVIYSRIPYLNISLIFWAIHRSNLRRLIYYSRVCSGTPPSAPLHKGIALFLPQNYITMLWSDLSLFKYYFSNT